jgi:regulator of protease activity HflC (stomatin/prohibitin superfamily)
MSQGLLVVGVALALLVIWVLRRTVIVVPQQSAFIVELLGKYSRTLSAGLHILVPFMENVAYKHNLKERAIDIPEQICITKDNVQVGIDGVLYLQILDAARASYGISDYNFAIAQLAQTTLRSEIGKLDLDRTFEERQTINVNVVNELDKATEPWGVKVLRYEIKNINPPHDVLQAMEKQMRAEREKRARREDQPGRGREAARDQGIRGRAPTPDQRGSRRGRGDSGGREGNGRGLAARRRGGERAGRARGDAAARRGGLHPAVRPPREGDQHARRPRERERRRGDDRARDQGVRADAPWRRACGARARAREIDGLQTGSRRSAPAVTAARDRAAVQASAAE